MERSDRHTSGITTALIVRYLRSTGGDKAVSSALEIAGVDKSIKELEDERSWSTYDEKIALLKAASGVLNDPHVARHIGETVLSLSVGAPVKLLLRALGSPGQVLRNITRTAPKFTTVSDMEALNVGRTNAVVTYCLHEGFKPSRFDCDLNIGLISQVPALFGLPPATIEHPECQVEGAARCVYEVRWPERSRLPWRGHARKVAYLEDQVATLTERAEALQRAVGYLVSPGDIDEVLERIAAGARDAVRAQAYVLAVRPTARSKLAVHHDGIAEEDARELAHKIFAGRPDKERVLVVEVASSQRNYGRLAAVYSTSGSFFPEEARLLAAYGRHAAVALDVATALEEARAQGHTSHGLLELAGSLARATTTEEVTRRLAEAVPEMVGADRSVIYLWDETTQTLAVRAVSGYSADAEETLLNTHFRPEDTPLFENLLQDPGPQHFLAEAVDDDLVRKYMQAYDAAESYAMPITSRGELIGVITATRVPESPPLVETVVERMAGVADQAAVALENVRLLEQERATVERLREANLFKSRFLSMVSHELRTPLAAITGMAKTLLTRGDRIDQETTTQFLESIAERGSQLERLVEDLLQSSRDVELRTGSTDIAELARAAAYTARQLAPDRLIIFEGPEQLPAVADAGRVRQVLDNLLTNAIRYAPDSEIRVMAGRRGSDVWLAVEDDGPGMTAEQVERAFDAFYQAHDFPVSGVGLGLYISRRIAEAHGGDVQIESELDKGTRVIVSLPAAGGPGL
jgi:signal transduction histidine kinase